MVGISNARKGEVVSIYVETDAPRCDGLHVLYTQRSRSNP